MVRSRVLSFMSAFGAPKSPTSTSFSGPQNQNSPTKQDVKQDVTVSSSPQHVAAPARDSPTPPRTRTERSSSRPMSMVQTYQPPLMEIAQDTIPELQPIFSFLNSHANKLYQEGYFLKLNDLDTQGRPFSDRSWTESFAQLVGTVLSLWDASALDVAGQDGEVAPSFINLADASIKMIETLPTRSQDVEPLQNVLSISTAGKNRYLFHFNSLHSLTQWTAAIRLAMFENATLQEAYTGSLIAGKGKLLNNIRVIMDRIRIRNEDWARVRFGAGTPWRRCWCVITPPDEKDIQKQQKQLKKRSAYERTPALKGNIKFYDTKKTKKAQPIATINDAYSAYALYPQSKPLIDQSTLVKIEGSITIHSTPETTTEGFVFVMPEVHPAVSGFEMMLRYIFPVYDVFALYGRPNRLIADTLDTKSLMFAMPQEKRYGYLEILDVAGLIHETGSQSWSEREWRKKMKELTSTRMTRMTANGRTRSRASSYRGYRSSLPPSRASTLRFEDAASIKSQPSLPTDAGPVPPPHRSDSAPPEQNPFQTPTRPRAQHQRSFSDALAMSTPPRQRSQRYGTDSNYTPSRLSHEQSRPSNEGTSPGRPSYEEVPAPPPPVHAVPIGMAARKPQMQGLEGPSERSSSESERRLGVNEANPQEIHQDIRPAPPPAIVAPPPAFAHQPGAKPQKRPGVSPEMRRANSRLSITTLSQLADAGKAGSSGVAAAGAAAAWKSNGSQRDRSTSEDQGQRGVNLNTTKNGITADRSSPAEGMVLANDARPYPNRQGSSNTSALSNRSDAQPTPYYKDKPLMSSYDLLTTTNQSSRAVSPLSQTATSSPPQQQTEDSLTDGRNYSGSNATQPLISQSPPATINKPPPFPMNPHRPLPHRSSTSKSINRKPVPSKTPPPPTEPTPTQPSPERPVVAEKSSLDSLHDQYIDEEALSQVLAAQHTQSLTSESYNGLPEDDNSVYDDDSTVSPDYASTRKSTDTKRSRPSVDKPRRGVLKTVGTVEPVQQEVQVGDIRYRPGATPEPMNPDIPTVDFGPTQAYNPGASSRPNTSGTTTQLMEEPTKLPDRFTPSPRNESPIETKRSSVVYPSGHGNDSRERPPSRNFITPEPLRQSPSGSPSAVADNNDNRRSLLWQPGATIGGGSPGSRQSITPEQFVQQRAAANRKVTPVFAHARKTSGSSTTPPPAVSRHSSGEWPIQQQKRQSSYQKELPPRPQSRTASTMMNVSGDYASYLSAREQEHVARVTGSPLINMAGNTNRNSLQQGAGLVGAIEAREKEKKEIKQGLGGQMVQQAIAQRQQHSQGAQKRQSSVPVQTQSYQRRQSSLPPPTPQYAMPGQYPQSPGSQYQTPGVAQPQPSWNLPQQQQQYAPYQQYPQQHHASGTPPVIHQNFGIQPALQYQQLPQQYQQVNFQQPAQYGQNQQQQQQQQYYGPYFGNGQGGRQ